MVKMYQPDMKRVWWVVTRLLCTLIEVGMVVPPMGLWYHRGTQWYHCHSQLLITDTMITTYFNVLFRTSRIAKNVNDVFFCFVFFPSFSELNCTQTTELLTCKDFCSLGVSNRYSDFPAVCDVTAWHIPYTSMGFSSTSLFSQFPLQLKRLPTHKEISRQQNIQWMFNVHVFWVVYLRS